MLQESDTIQRKEIKMKSAMFAGVGMLAQWGMLGVGMLAFLLTAGCHKAVPVAAKTGRTGARSGSSKSRLPLPHVRRTVPLPLLHSRRRGRNAARK